MKFSPLKPQSCARSLSADAFHNGFDRYLSLFLVVSTYSAGTRWNRSRYGESTPWNASSESNNRFLSFFCSRSVNWSERSVMRVQICGKRMLQADCITKCRINCNSLRSPSVHVSPTCKSSVFSASVFGSSCRTCSFALSSDLILLVMRTSHVTHAYIASVQHIRSIHFEMEFTLLS